MTALTKEQVFKAAIWNLHKIGKYPGPTAINRYLGRTHLAKINNINGTECRWRDEEFERLGIQKKNPLPTQAELDRQVYERTDY